MRTGTAEGSLDLTCDRGNVDACVQNSTQINVSSQSGHESVLLFIDGIF